MSKSRTSLLPQVRVPVMDTAFVGWNFVFVWKWDENNVIWLPSSSKDGKPANRLLSTLLLPTFFGQPT